MAVINRFRECREKTPYSQKQVALIIGVKPPQLSKWERGEGISRQNCVKLAKLYNVSVDYLLGLTDDPYSGFEGPVHKEPATAGGLDAEFSARVGRLNPANREKMLAYLDGLLDSQAEQAP